MKLIKEEKQAFNIGEIVKSVGLAIMMVALVSLMLTKFGEAANDNETDAIIAEGKTAISGSISWITLVLTISMVSIIIFLFNRFR